MHTWRNGSSQTTLGGTQGSPVSWVFSNSSFYQKIYMKRPPLSHSTAGQIRHELFPEVRCCSHNSYSGRAACTLAKPPAPLPSPLLLWLPERHLGPPALFFLSSGHELHSSEPSSPATVRQRAEGFRQREVSPCTCTSSSCIMGFQRCHGLLDASPQAP